MNVTEKQPRNDIKLTMCDDKEAFHTKEMALKIMNRMAAAADDAKLNVYKCNFCNKYHIGNVGYRPTNIRRQFKFDNYKRIQRNYVISHLDNYYEDSDD